MERTMNENTPPRGGFVGRLAYAYEGQTVDAFVAGRWLRCVVVSACGDMARVANELHGFEDWRRVDELRRPEAVTKIAELEATKNG